MFFQIEEESPKTFENVYNLPTTKSKTYSDAEGAIFALNLTKQGRFLFASGSDRIIRLYNPYKDEFSLIREFTGGHSQAIRDIVVTFDLDSRIKFKLKLFEKIYISLVPNH